MCGVVSAENVDVNMFPGGGMGPAAVGRSS